MSRQPHVLSDDDIAFVKLCAAEGLPLHTTARKLGIASETLSRALARQDLGEWRKEAFPPKQGWGSGAARKGKEQPSKVDGHLRKTTAGDASASMQAPQSRPAQWLTQAWR